MRENENQATLPTMEEYEKYPKETTVINHDIEITCDGVKVELGSHNDIKVSLESVNANELADIALEVCEAEYLARNIVLLHLDEVKEALEELENE